MSEQFNNVFEQLKNILDDSLSLQGRTKDWTIQMPLLGNLPELDSIAVMNVVVGIENYFQLNIEDEDINAEVFATLESLTSMVYQKLNSHVLN